VVVSFHLFEVFKNRETNKFGIFPARVTSAAKVTGWLFVSFSLKVAERGGAGSAERSFASKYLEF